MKKEWSLTRMSMRFIALPALLFASSLAGGQESGRESAAEVAAQAVDQTVIAPPIIIDSDTNQYDLRSGVTRFSDNVSIQRGAMLVYADEGVVHQEDGRITLVELFGNPTTWRDRLDDGSIVEGRADQIEFEVIENVVTLTGNARLRHEQGEFTGNQLVYDLDTESLSGRGTDGNQARVVLEGDSMRNRGSGEDEAAIEPEAEDAQDTEEGGPIDPPTGS